VVEAFRVAPNQGKALSRKPKFRALKFPSKLGAAEHRNVDCCGGPREYRTLKIHITASILIQTQCADNNIN